MLSQIMIPVGFLYIGLLRHLMFFLLLVTCGYQLNSTAVDFHFEMKHLDVVDGEIAGVPQDQRRSLFCTVGKQCQDSFRLKAC